MFLATQQRNLELDNLFTYEVALPPPSITSKGKMNLMKDKAKLMPLLWSGNLTESPIIDSTTIIIDGSHMVRLLHPGLTKSFEDYSSTE